MDSFFFLKGSYSHLQTDDSKLEKYARDRLDPSLHGRYNKIGTHMQIKALDS